MLTHTWHSLLNMKKYDKQWHEDDIKEEYEELRAANSLLEKWSEYSDVCYTYSRAKWTGFDINLPIPLHMYYVGLLYMFPKYSLRFLFFRRVGRKFGKKIHEVRNPRKRAKLHIIAERNEIPSREFIARCEKQLRYWPLLK